MNRLNLGLPFSVCQTPGCRQTANLKRCGACQVVPHCSAEHQKRHRNAHKLHCTLIKESREKLAKEEATLRQLTNDPLSPPKPLENPEAIGMFWTIHPTRPYMNALFDVSVQQLNVRTGEAVEAALATLMEMLRLCRGDNKGVRSQVPALLLRLGRDQEAFDFIKWWADKSPGYDWEDTSQPYLDTKGEDPFEPVNIGTGSGISLDLSMKLALLMIKCRLFYDLSMLDGYVKKLGDKAPEDRMEIVKEEAMTDILLNRRDIVDAPEYFPIMAKVRQQMIEMYTDVMKHNKYIIPAIENPNKYAYAQPMIYTFGDEGEAILAFRNSWYTWSESSQVLQTILPLLKRVFLGQMA